MSQSPQKQGILLIGIFLDAYLFGLVTQQFYGYWTYGFKDPIHLRLFVIVEFLLVALQSVLMWHFGYTIFITVSSPSKAPPSQTWAGPVNSLCQLFIIILANGFLAARIHTLTRSRAQTALVLALSTLAFTFGLVNIVGAWAHPSSQSLLKTASIIWHAVQAIVECLISLILIRVLLKSRSGFGKSNSIVNHLIRNIIQTGCLATIWAVVALGSWFLLPNVTIYRLFDMTSGTVYAHAIFDTLLARAHLRGRTPSTFLDLTLPSQEERRQLSQRPVILQGSVSVASPTHKNDFGVIELKRLPPTADSETSMKTDENLS
ncbi:hypothetical protein BGW80DRAFT_753663 [Lactifluus volemus]|nr:hypothetical protein BGW80DRAFT_753663 [Lactifluus volemus]